MTHQRYYQNQNACRTLNVLSTSHVSARSAATRVTWSSAASAPCAGSTTTAPCACAPRPWRATPTLHVSSVSIHTLHTGIVLLLLMTEYSYNILLNFKNFLDSLHIQVFLCHTDQIYL